MKTEIFKIERINVLGVGVHALNMKNALETIREAISQRQKGYICVTGVHGISEAQADDGFKRILNNAFLCTPDGMPLVWVGWLKGRKEMDRVYGPDLMLNLLALSEKSGYRHFFYGGADGTVNTLREKLQKRFPRLQICGVYEPPFRPLTPSEFTDLQRQLEVAKPDVMWVGLSTPKQEKFMAEHLARLNVTLMVGVGAAFDFHAGKTRQAPHWMQRSGLEWFFRLCTEPKRLWRRYLKNNPLFAIRIFLQFTGLKKYPLQ